MCNDFKNMHALSKFVTLYVLPVFTQTDMFHWAAVTVSLIQNLPEQLCILHIKGTSRGLDFWFDTPQNTSLIISTIHFITFSFAHARITHYTNYTSHCESVLKSTEI